MNEPSPRQDQLRTSAPYFAVTLAIIVFHYRAALPGQAFAGPDLRSLFFALREAVAAALRAGHLPEWQRGIFLGYPLLADPQAAVFAPTTWLTLPLDSARAITVGTLLHLCVGGWGMVFWLRLRGLSSLPSILGAVLFVLGAKETVHIQHWNFAASTAWWPWMLAGMEGFADQGRGRFLALTSAATALSWFGGAPQMSYFGTAIAEVHALVLAPALWRRRRADAALLLAAVPMGILLAAPLILPAVELARLGPRGHGTSYAFATSFGWPDRWGLALLLLPKAFGGGWHRPNMNLWEATGYLGILPLALVAAAPLRRRGVSLFLGLGVLGVWLSFGQSSWLGLHRAFYDFLPGYGAFRVPTRSLMVTSFASALLAAEALDAMGRDEVRRWDRAALALLVILAVTPSLTHFSSFSLDRVAARENTAVTMALAAAGLGWLVAVRLLGRTPRNRAMWMVAAILFCLGDSYLAFGRMNAVAPARSETAPLPELVFRVPAAPEPRRVAVVTEWGRAANAPLRRGWEGVTGFSPTSIGRVGALLDATATHRLVLPGPARLDTADATFPRPDPSSPLWPLFATPLVVTDRPSPLPRIARLPSERNASAHRSPALPRVFWTGAWTIVGDEGLTGAQTGSHPLIAAAAGDRAILAPETPLPLPTAGEPSGPASATSVRVADAHVEASVSAPRDGIAVVLEPWFPGWRATVDGHPAPVGRANYAFMAVPVPAGDHELRLEYRPTRLWPGVWGCSAAATSLLVTLWWRRRGRCRYRQSAPPRW